MKNSLEICVRAVIRKSGKTLVCLHKKHRKYFFPGGHVDFGETAEKALRRELKEELDILVKSMSFIGTVENIYGQEGRKHHEVNLVFSVSVDKVKDKSLEDHIDFFFLNKNDFKKTKVLPLVLKEKVIKWLKDKKIFWASHYE